MAGNGSGDPETEAVDRAPDRGERYRRLIEYSTDLITVLDEEGQVTFMSPSSKHVLGADPETYEGTNALEHIHPEDREYVIEAFENLVENPEESNEVEYRYQAADDEWVWLETRGQNRLDDVVIDGIVVVSRDITARKRRENAMETLHDRTREMLQADSKEEIARLAARTAAEAMNYPFTVVRLLSGDGQHLEPVAVTDGAKEVLGDRPTYEIGEGTAGTAFERGEVTIFEDLQSIDDGFDRGDARAGIFIPIGEHGVIGIGETENDALDQEDIQLARILAANTEVAIDRLEREQELARQNERLEEFASVISHDLSSPLNVAKGRLELVEGNETQVEPIRSALERMETLIQDVLALARQGQTVDETEPVAIADITEKCFKNVSTGDATISVESDETILADPARLPEVFENLFRNSVEHGGEDVTIRVGTMRNGFYVEDDGPGIPDDDRERVFESGFSTSESGTGFGLSIVQQIAEAHGWSVAVTESESGGARFEFADVTKVHEP